VIGENDYNLGSYTNFILSIIGFVATVFSHIFLADRFNRKLLMLISTVVFSICNFMIMTGILTGITYLTFAFMIIFIFVFGVTYSIVSSIYPAEILRSKQVSYTSLTAWPAMILATLIPPIVSDVITPSHLPWPIFLFYGVYALFSTIYIWCYAV
jgi:MFS family permease